MATQGYAGVGGSLAFNGSTATEVLKWSAAKTVDEHDVTAITLSAGYSDSVAGLKSSACTAESLRDVGDIGDYGTLTIKTASDSTTGKFILTGSALCVEKEVVVKAPDVVRYNYTFNFDGTITATPTDTNWNPA